MREPEKALATYQALQAKVDLKVQEIRAAYPRDVACRPGCHGCCLPGLTVSPVEAAALRAYVAARPDLARALGELAAANPFGNTRCQLLAADGRCSVYAARPLVCRSHGAPLAVRATPRGAARRDACPLNFTETPLASLDDAATINLDTLNTILSLLNRQYAGDADAAARVPLAAAALCP